MVEVPDSTTRYIQSDSGKPTKDLFNWMHSISRQIADIFSGTGGGLFSSGLPAFSVHKNGTPQGGVVSATTTQVTWATPGLYNIGGFFASHVWTPSAGRIALVFGFVADGAIAAGIPAAAFITKNGATTVYKAAIQTSIAGTVYSMIAIEDVATGTDAYGTAVNFGTTAGTGTIRGGTDQTWFMGHWISP